MPKTEAEVAEAVAEASRTGRRLRTVGAGHSWSSVAVPEDLAMSLDRYAGETRIDREDGTVTAPAGMRIRELTTRLAAVGLTLPIVGSIQEQSIAGAVATGTHGSSLRHGNLGTLVTAARMVSGTGDVVSVGSDDERLDAVRVHLGALGVLTEVTLQVRPARNLEQLVEHVPIEDVAPALREIAASAEYVKVWWFPNTSDAQVVRYRETDAAPTRRPSAATRRTLDEQVMQRAVFPVIVRIGHRRPDLTARVNQWLSRRYLGPRSQVGRDTLMLNTSMPLRHRETEAGIPLERAGAALAEVVELFRDGRPAVDFPLEIRFVKGDSSWLSPATGRDTCQIGAYATDGPDCQRYFDGFWSIMRSAGARPHWGKEFDHGADELRGLYGDYDRFVSVRDAMDPDRVFRSAFLTGTLGR